MVNKRLFTIIKSYCLVIRVVIYCYSGLLTVIMGLFSCLLLLGVIKWFFTISGFINRLLISYLLLLKVINCYYRVINKLLSSYLLLLRVTCY